MPTNEERVTAIMKEGWYSEFMYAGGTKLTLELPLPDGKWLRAEFKVLGNGKSRVHTSILTPRTTH
ncbi:MAG: hypothetical protein V3U93_03460 [Alphaproteobacteria bacterium]